ncbi:MAG: GEGP motif-containing diheme protein [Thermodesulfobacteriota bacterium]
MKKVMFVLIWVLGLSWVTINALPALAAYSSHQNDYDVNNFLSAYPFTRLSKLNDCSLCHPGGNITQNNKTTYYGSCDYCHLSYGITPPYGVIPLNPYGTDYKNAGRTQQALHTIEAIDSDGDGYSNVDEIFALTSPGNSNDNPALLPATTVVLNLKNVKKLPKHKQFLLLNAMKSQDFYATYQGVAVADLLASVYIRPEATQITVFAPDGFSKTFPIDVPDPQTSPYQYDVMGPYPKGTYYAGLDFVDYPTRHIKYKNGDIIPDELYLILAYTRENASLAPGILEPDPNNTARLVLNGEGPFRLVNPQKGAGSPDRPSTAPVPVGDGYDYDSNKDHNAGNSVRSVTAIRVEPLPPGVTDFGWTEGGWNLVDQQQLVIYGAIDPPIYPITGQIFDKHGNPVEGVLVNIGLASMGQVGRITSDADGKFELSFPVGSYTITASKAGYLFKPASININLSKRGAKVKFHAIPAP